MGVIYYENLYYWCKWNGREKISKKILSSDLYQTQINKICLFDINFNQTKDNLHLTHIKGNIEDLTQIKKLASERFDIIFHLAAIVSGEAEENFEKGLEC